MVLQGGITGLTNGTEYSVQFTALNKIGESKRSIVLKATPSTVPGQPSIKVTKGNTKFDYTITAPSSNGGSPITKYTIKYASTSKDSGTSLTGSVTGLTNGTSYSVSVIAVNKNGNSEESDKVLVIPSTVPGVPTIKATAGDKEFSYVITAPSSTGGSAITKYEIDAGTGTTTSTTSTTGKVTGLTNNHEYSVKVRATNANGSSAYSGVVKVTPKQASTRPHVPSVALTKGNAEFSYTITAPASDGGSPITNYILTHSGTDKDIATNALSGKITGLTNGTTYKVTVKAVNAIGTSDPSEEKSVVPSTVPAVPTMAVTKGAGKVSYTITPKGTGGSSITGYTIDYNGTTKDVTTVTGEITGLTNGTEYSFKVLAKNANGPSAYSSVVKATPSSTPASPALTTTARELSFDYKITPNATNGSAITKYYINYDGTDKAVSASGTVSELENKEYTVTAKVENANGKSIASAASKVTPTAPPAPEPEPEG